MWIWVSTQILVEVQKLNIFCFARVSMFLLHTHIKNLQKTLDKHLMS